MMSRSSFCRKRGMMALEMINHLWSIRIYLITDQFILALVDTRSFIFYFTTFGAGRIEVVRIKS